MSRIRDLGKDLEHLPEVLAEYENHVSEASQQLSFKGKTLEAANRENPSWQLYYSLRLKELETIVSFIEQQVDRVRGALFKQYTEQYSRELSDRSKDKYIDNEQKYLNKRELYLEAKEVYEKYRTIVDAFEARGYALNNITRARVADVHTHILD